MRDMALPDRRTVNVLVTILLFAVVLAIVYIARKVIVIFIFAILLAYLIDPLVRFLQNHSLFFRNLRGPHVLVAYLAFVLCLGLMGHAVAPGLVGSELFKTGPAVVEGLSTGDIAETIGEQYQWDEDQRLHLKNFLLQHRDLTLRLVANAERFTSNAMAVLIVVPILAIFFLSEGRSIADAFIRFLSTEESRQTVREVADELNLGLTRYVRAMVTLGSCSFVFYSIAMLLARFPHAIALGFLGGALEFIPVVGWMSSAAAIVTVGFATHSHWIWMAGLLGIWRLAMDYFISPRVVGHSLAVHPLLVIFAVMVGAEVDGIVGIYLSIPSIVVLRVVWQKCLNGRVRVSTNAYLTGPVPDPTNATVANAAVTIPVTFEGSHG